MFQHALRLLVTFIPFSFYKHLIQQISLFYYGSKYEADCLLATNSCISSFWEEGCILSSESQAIVFITTSDALTLLTNLKIASLCSFNCMKKLCCRSYQLAGILFSILFTSTRFFFLKILSFAIF